MGRAIVWQKELQISNSGISASYALVGTLVTSARCILINNLTNADLQLSFGLVDSSGNLVDNLVIGARTGEVLDIMSNSKPGNAGDDGAMQPNMTSIYVKLINAAPMPFTGSLYVSYFNEYGEF